MKDYIIYMVLLAFLLFNLYVMLVGQRRKKMSAADVRRQEGELGRIALEEQKRYGIRFTAHSTYMNDRGKVILAAIDPRKKVLGIFFGDNVQIIPYDDLEGARAVSSSDGKYTYSINVEITRKSGSVISYPFATEKRRKKGWISQFIERDSGEFVTAVNSLVKDGEKPSATQD